MLLDPAEQQFDLPTGLVEDGNLDCAADQIVGQKRDHTTLLSSELDAAQRDRQSGVTLADELDLVIGEDLKAVSLALTQGATLDRTKASRRLRPGNKESLAIIDLLPPVEAAIAFVEHIGRAGLDRRLPANLDVIDVGIRHIDTGRHGALWVIDDVQLHAADAAVPLRPRANLPEWDRAGVDQAHHLHAFAPGLLTGHRRQAGKDLRKNADRTTSIGIRQRRTVQFFGAEMVVVLRICVEAFHHGPQTVVSAELRINQRHQMIPALEQLAIRIAPQTIHNRLKLPAVNRFKELSKNAIAKSHARPLSESRQPESTCFAQV